MGKEEKPGTEEQVNNILYLYCILKKRRSETKTDDRKKLPIFETTHNPDCVLRRAPAHYLNNT